MLAIPTILDRAAQQFIRVGLEKMVEPLCHPSSFGYRPGKSAYDAVDQSAKNCWERWYVVDFDIKGFFDNTDQKQMMKHPAEVHGSAAGIALLRTVVKSSRLQSGGGTHDKEQGNTTGRGNQPFAGKPVSA